MAADPAVGPWLRYVAANVRRLRERQGLTQEQLAGRAGVAPRYVQEVERARTNLSLKMLVSLADALDVDPRRLMRPAPPLTVARPGRPAHTRSRMGR
ncbi:helix-turn-helix domain-containing protein [Candidatus Binatia bacterium]|nr:helix-turn-helix domain-containing protein [Candidatus Binatia bacterium]